MGWRLASDAWVERMWARVGAKVVRKLSETSSWYAREQKVPVVVRGKLKIAQGRALVAPEVEVLAPSVAGWRRFLELGPESGLKFGEIDAAGRYWWARRIPRDLLVVREERKAA